MKNTICINAPMIDSDDLEQIRKDPVFSDTEFELFMEHGLMESAIMQFVFMFIQGVGYNAAYDMIKYSVLNVLGIVKRKKHDIENPAITLRVDVYDKDGNGKTYNHRSTNVSINYFMSADEIEKVLNAMTNSLLIKDC